MIYYITIENKMYHNWIQVEVQSKKKEKKEVGGVMRTANENCFEGIVSVTLFTIAASTK